MPSFFVSKDARRIARTVGGHLNADDKARVNRRNRRRFHQQLEVFGEDADFTPRLWTAWDVI